MNFSQAFMEAGANAVTITLWPVFDQSTSEFMIEMYQKIENGFDYSTALKKTKIDFINGDHDELYKHPSFWAPYVYYGK